MRKSTLIYTVTILLILLSVVLYVLLQKENPQYLTLNIPMPQSSPAYSNKYAKSEEFSTFVQNDSGHRYFMYRMYISVILGDKGFETKNDVENYYDSWMKNLGWNETQTNLCDPYMREFLPAQSYRAYVYPTKYSVQPIACLATWLEFGEGNYLDVLIKTINPSENVLNDWD